MIDDEDEDYDEAGEEDEDESTEEDEDGEERDTTVRAGRRVQVHGDSGEFKAGLVEKLIPAQKSRPNEYWRIPDYEKVEHEWKQHAQVKWDDGATTTVRVDELQVEDNPIERAFREINEKASEEIEKHLSDATDALSKALDLSEKYGIPFDTNISFLSNTYTPDSLKKLHPKVSKEFIEEVTGAYSEDDFEYGGWRHSAVC